LRNNRSIFCAVKHILGKHVKNILENVVLDLITLIRVKRWVTMQKAHFKHTLTYIQDYPITNTNFKAKTHCYIKHIDLKEPHPSSTISPLFDGDKSPWLCCFEERSILVLHPIPKYKN